MNIKKSIWKTISIVLVLMTVLNFVCVAYAANVGPTEWVTDEEIRENIEVTYNQLAVFLVTIPKRITLGEDKQAAYSVKVSGSIDKFQIIYVKPIDGIEETSDIDFYMKDLALDNKKQDVVATVAQDKTYWDSVEAANGYEKKDNYVSAPDLDSGKWRGVFAFEIKSHEHSYVDGVCESCGMEHNHSYVDTITREPTCEKEGELTHTCECGHVYTEEIPKIEHTFGNDNICTECGYAIKKNVYVWTRDEVEACGNNPSENDGDNRFAYGREHFIVNYKSPITILSEGGSITVQNYFSYFYHENSQYVQPRLYKWTGGMSPQSTDTVWTVVQVGKKSMSSTDENYRQRKVSYTFVIEEPGVYMVSLGYLQGSAHWYGWGPIYYSTSGY